MRSFTSAIILAAGASRRMGSPKQLMKIGDRTLLETTLHEIQKSRAQETILVLGYESGKILQTVDIDSNVKVVINSSYTEGMSSSIKAGLASAAAEATAALIILADQPLLSSKVVNRLIEEYETSQAAIVIPVYKGFRGNPVLIDRSLFPEMMQISGDIGCRSLFGLHSDQIRKVALEDIGILVDIDTPEDMAKFALSGTAHTDLVDRWMEKTGTQIVIIGSEDVAKALARLAGLIKLRVIVIDPLLRQNELPEVDLILNELDLSKAAITADTFLVIASRGKFDEEALQQAVKSPSRYIALMSGKKRGSDLIERMGLKPEEAQRIHCPAGLKIGATTPEEIALSIMAEIVSLKSEFQK